MSWSWSLGRISDIPIRVHMTFLVVLALGALAWGRHGLAGAVFGVLLVCALFGCVVLHELGHALVARRYGLRPREIVLLPIGGVAIMSGRATRPIQEIAIAVAGPAVNVLLAVALAGVLAAMGIGSAAEPFGFADASAAPSLATALGWLLSANVVMATFNLLPAFPLDGGRVLRALLAFKWSRRRATEIASLVGQVIAAGMFVSGLVFGAVALSVIAVFVFLGARRERVAEAAQDVLRTVRAEQAYNRGVRTLVPTDRVSDVASAILTTYQPDFAVLDDGELVGVVGRNDVIAGLSVGAHQAFITGGMQRDFLRVEAETPLDEVARLMEERSSRVAAVHREGRFLGLLSAEDMAEVVLLLRASEKHDERGRDAPPRARVLET